MGWLAYALVSAGAAALTAILAKVGIEGVPSNLATAIRTIVITGFAWAIVTATGEHHALAFDDSWRARAVPFDMAPGAGVHIPVTHPHWVTTPNEATGSPETIAASLAATAP